MHPTYAVSVRREPLGILNAWNWAREFKDENGGRGGVCESVRWVESYEHIARHAGEMVAPAGSHPVVWRLLTNRSVATLRQATELIDWYRARWEIEMFFLILKEGCKVEQLQLEDIERLEVALALYMVIAWRINRLMRLGRTLPDMAADVVFEQDEWHAAFILNKKPIPRQIPTLNTVVRLIAQRGGFLGRKGDGEPGALARPGAWPVQLWRHGSAGTDLKPNSGESVSLRLRARYAGDGYEKEGSTFLAGMDERKGIAR